MENKFLIVSYCLQHFCPTVQSLFSSFTDTCKLFIHPEIVMALYTQSQDLSQELDHLVHGVLSSGRITTQDKQRFLDLLVSGTTLDSQQLAQVRQVSDRLQMGLLKVVD
jgi:hypothetical protein